LWIYQRFSSRREGVPKVNRPTLKPPEQVLHLSSVFRRVENLGDLTGEVMVTMRAMAQAYEEITGHYGFVCRGCEDSCCRTIFYHHTYAEFALLSEGLWSLTTADLATVFERAQAVEGRLAEDRADATEEPPRAMCPLNRAGRCILYAHRPMICRLHGIPHLLRRPDGRIIEGPGCHRFEALCEGDVEQRLDRTPHYKRLAQVEQRLRQRLEAPVRLHMTLAEWLFALSLAKSPVASRLA
jgi:Fe-S-cluster containining protein